MNKLLAICIALLSCSFSTSAQNVNWSSAGDNGPHLLYLQAGYDFGMTAQLGYGYRLSTFRPLLLNIDLSLPMGHDRFDDLKVRYGGQLQLFETGGFAVTARAYGNFRRYQTELVRMAGFGAELSTVAGYYGRRWHVAGEFGFDKAITTHLKHSDVMRSDFPGIRDGWYIPSGGHYFYGMQGGLRVGKGLDVSLRMGFTNAEGRDEDAILPYYAQLGIAKWW